MRHTSTWAVLAAILGLLSACSQTQVPGGVKVGKPYVIEGKTYYPEYDDSYDKIGMASWYGPGFHGKNTANGEVFNQNELTAAHPTLPMPSLVRVTNLENGKSAVIRVNDRGPFKDNRIIDLSRKSAQTLGIHSLAKVRVQFLRKESAEYIASLKGGDTVSMAALNERDESKKDSAAATEPASSEIVESTVATSSPGQTVVESAPVMSVGQGDIKRPAIASRDIAPVRKVALIKDAAADEVDADVSPGAGNADENKASPKILKVLPNETIAEEAEPVSIIQPGEAEKSPAAKPPVASKAMTQASPSAAPGGFYIQAGSFASEENARKLKERMKGVSRIAVDRVEMNNRTWWRVRVGPFSDRTQADNQLEKIRALRVPDARIVHP